MPNATVVTPELLRSTQQAIESALQYATAVAGEYLSSHENVIGVASWHGQASFTSLATAGRINHDLQQTVAGGQRLAHGLGRAAVLMENHESDASQGFTGLFGGSQ
ncbi:type VII secretion protein EsxD [Mycobacterium sp.]|uniref:type VII secretion protein EsxD n=1 Tax=Mycobacterium sp. TaxID=1785 RepID=UPI0031D9A069